MAGQGVDKTNEVAAVNVSEFLPVGSVHDVFVNIAAQHPKDCALVWPWPQSGPPARRYSYAELQGRASRLADLLRTSGVAPGDRVALSFGRTPAAVVSTLATLQVGAIYVPLDLAYPAERLALMAQVSAPALLLTDESSAARASMLGLATWVLDDEGGFSLPNVSALPASQPTRPSEKPGDAAAYIMFTSGSTGTPKGVVITHRGITRLVCGSSFTPLSSATTFLQLAPTSFDASTLELWGPLLNGGRVVLYPGGSAPDPERLATLIAEESITTVWLTASLFNTLVAESPECLRGLQEILTGGEALSVAHVRLAHKALPDVQLVNGYGPTECTTFAACYRIPRELPPELMAIPIGYSIARTSLYIVDENGEGVADDVEGELFIGGDGLAIEYFGRPDLTAERFVQYKGERVYRTGDRVRRTVSGALDFVGRADDQIKLSGHRIELGEVEAAIRALPEIREALVAVRPDASGTMRLVAYAVPADANSFDAPAALSALASRLPSFMVPSAVVVVERIPLTANGKADRKALVALQSSPPPVATAATIRPQNPDDFAALVEHLWNEVLGHPSDAPLLPKDKGFFELGGTSLLAIRLAARLKAALGRAVPLLSLYEHPTQAAFVAFLEGEQTSAPRTAQSRPLAAPSQAEPIAIIAMAGRFPGADSIEELWQVLDEGRDTITQFRADEVDPSVDAATLSLPDYVKARGVLRNATDFDAGFFDIAPREADVMDPQHRLLLELAVETLERGGINPRTAAQQGTRIGLYAGCGNTTYFNDHLRPQPDVIERAGAFVTRLGNEKDFLTTRVAHRLGLRGPAVTVQTACSTSLVAIATAFEALRAGTTDLALAGGVSIHTPMATGYLAVEGAMLSPDGHTRSFDVASMGTSFNDGGGLVLLKPLSRALADQDPIVAVLRGVGLNNDGGDKMSFSAPSIAGQAHAIAAAFASAGLHPDQISYVEAHGTATPVGDPIEVAALNLAYHELGCRKHHAVGLGSLKSNIGHTVAAAGVGGLIKTVLALQHRRLPATVHFTEPSPHLPLKDSPFRIIGEAEEWAGPYPRRAGVSSFGVGGTNAHVLVEEAPVEAQRHRLGEPAASPVIFALSARSGASLGGIAKNLKEFLDRNDKVDLADVAFTLAVGRTHHERRKAFVASSARTLIEQLASFDTKSAKLSARSANPTLAFMFPGQGTQYPGMGLSVQDPAFRAAFDDCVRIYLQRTGRDFQALLASDESTLNQTAVAQPAIFAVSLSLALALRARGILPAAAIGHSVGEFVAATLAGVMSADDAMALVIERGELMQGLPAGSMLAVRLSAQALLTQLPQGLDLAAENAPAACVVAGPTPLVQAFASALEATGVACRMSRTSHAFHSAMMDPAVEQFTQAVGRVALQAPAFPVISTRTGRVLQPHEATDPHYWGQHLRHSVQFSSACAALLLQRNDLLLEVGPGRTLTALAQKQPAAGKRVLPAAMGTTAAEEIDAVSTMEATLWEHGVVKGLAPQHFGSDARRIVLPTYCFDRKRHWVDAPPSQDRKSAPTVPSAAAAHLTEKTMSNRKENLVAAFRALLEDSSGRDLAAESPDANFTELGFDSLELTQAAQAASRKFGVKLKLKQLAEEYPCLEAIAGYLDTQLPAEAYAPSSSPDASAKQMPTAFAPLPNATFVSGPPSSGLDLVVQQQLAIMARQLEMLGGRSLGVSFAAAVPASISLAADPAPAPLPEPEVEAKHRHGPQLVIDKSVGHALSPTQEKHLARLTERYIARTAKSKSFTQRNRARVADPRTASGFKLKLKELAYPIVVDRSSGCRLWDIDGNEYVDMLNGYGSNFFGYGADFVKKALVEQMEQGMEIGPQTPLVEEVSTLVTELTGMERVAFCNTGSEAVLATFRMARTSNNRDLIVMFAGGYHGMFDEVVVKGTKKGGSLPAAPGIPRAATSNILVLDWASSASLDIIKQRAEEIAGVIVEPVQSRRPDVQPIAFLKELRSLTSAIGAALIFDEVVTGFRVAPGGAQELFGIRADLASYGKVVGAGLSIGIVAGDRAYMDTLDGGFWQYGDESVPEVGPTYFAGTFVRHPLAMAVSKAALLFMKARGKALQEGVSDTTTRLVDRLNALCSRQGAPVEIMHFASVMKIQLTTDVPYAEIFFHHLRERGVHVFDGRPSFLTMAHGEAELAHIEQAFAGAIADMQEGGFFAPPAIEHRQAAPPVPGARLGKDRDGNPAWFVPDPESPGRYVQVESKS